MQVDVFVVSIMLQSSFKVAQRNVLSTIKMLTYVVTFDVTLSQEAHSAIDKIKLSHVPHGADYRVDNSSGQHKLTIKWSSCGRMNHNVSSYY